ncbi:hypothetical protein SAY86_007619 [Trapa natans]|uniref:Apple domain-containing protein n=1 Tax=Trapa natans TaxID=22666 RepID=A0AAN7R0H6_TRANT|nr:hypothetical protein SAY86_007619 [Trapa natans]
MAGLRASVAILSWILPLLAAGAVETELLKGFKATPNRSDSAFQPVLADPTGKFSFGFLRVNESRLALAVVHVASSLPLWSADLAESARWSDRTELSFNGSLVILDPFAGVLWSTHTDGDRLVLLNSSDLQVQRGGDRPAFAVLWRSFQFPTNTLVENQNFTSDMSLLSSNGLYSMRMGDNFIGLYGSFKQGADQIYWKHKALEARADIVNGGGPIYARVEPDGYLAMYQNSSKPVDVETFSSFQRLINSFVLLRLEDDGNLKGYHWNGSDWVLDYRAITGICELPSTCGPYGLCSPENGSCTCMDHPDRSHTGPCDGHRLADLCAANSRLHVGFRVLRVKGVELPYKELMRYQTAPSLERCESICESNCSCFGAVYNNASGSCYVMDYPIQTLVNVGDEGKIGYFKVSDQSDHEAKGYRVGYGVGIVMWVLIGLALVGTVLGFGFYRWRRSRRGVKGYLTEENRVTPGQYKGLASASFKSIEIGRS